MRYITTKEAAEKWGVKERNVRELCQKGRVPGVIRSGRSWMIPDDATRPSIGRARKKEEASEKLHLFMNPTYSETHTFAYISPEEENICKATDHFLHGDFEKAESIILEMLEDCTAPNYMALSYLTLMMIYRNSKDNSLCLDEIRAKLYSLIQGHTDFVYSYALLQLFHGKRMAPLEITSLPSDLIPIFSFFNIEQNLWDSLAGRTQPDLTEIELLCASLSETLNPCILLHLHIALCMYYNILNQRDLYLFHLKKATAIALPRKWYTPFASYSYTCAWVEIKDMDDDAYKEIQSLSDTVIRNYISSGYFKSTIPENATSPLEVKVAIMLARGMSSPKIAKALDISLYKVKETLKLIYEHLGVENRDELKQFVNFHLKL